MDSISQVTAAVLANDFYSFVRHFWPVVSNDPFTDGRHVRALCCHLDLVARGEVQRLVVNLPIRHGKSLLVSVLFPVYRWLKWPSCRIISSTYSSTLTVRDAVRSRKLIESAPFKAVFGDLIRLSDTEARKDYYLTEAGGHRFSTSVGAKTAGFDADLVVCDDLHDYATRRSAAEREAAIDYFETSLSSRLVVTGREAIVVAGHRVHEDDVYARLGAEWTWLVLPEEADPEYTAGFRNDHWLDDRQPGELLWPEKFGPDQIELWKRQYRQDYWPIFAQRPAAAEGSLFQTGWFREYKQAGDDYLLGGRRYSPTAMTRVLVVDLAIGTRAGNDFTVAQVWDLGGGQMVLVHQHRAKVDGAAVVPLLVSLYRQWQPQFVGVESVAYQQVVLDQLRAANVPVKALRPGTQDKESRSVPAQIRAEAGTVWVPADRPWVTDLLGELAAFPAGKHDDQVDCLSYAAQLAEKFAGADAPEMSAEESAKKHAADVEERFQSLLWSGCPF